MLIKHNMNNSVSSVLNERNALGSHTVGHWNRGVHTRMIQEHSCNDAQRGGRFGSVVNMLEVFGWGFDRRILFKSVVGEVRGEGGVNK
jgi:hypothetical protein